MLSLLLTAAMAATPPTAATAPGDARVAPASGAIAKANAAADPAVMVCKQVEVTGSRFPTRTCHTRGEWSQMSADSRGAVDSILKNGIMPTGSGK